MKIGNVLRESRLQSKKSVKEVSDFLTKRGYKASEKTIYSWESGNSKPDIDIFMRLCELYGIKDVLNAFGYREHTEEDELQLSSKETEIIEKYRFITNYSIEGAVTIDTILDKEYTIAHELQRQKEYIAKLEALSKEPHNQNIKTRWINYYYRLASAGTGQILFDSPPTRRIEIPDIPEYKNVDYAIGVNGNSMEPTFQDNDTLLVGMTDTVERGEVGIFLVDGDCYVKQRGTEELISINQDCPNIPLNESARCMGKVIDKLR